MDITSISATLASLKAAKEIGQAMLEIKSATDIQTKVIDLQAKILEAFSGALDAKSECLQLVEENAGLKRELRDLREQVQTRQRMVFRDDVYWLHIEGHSPDQGPFCPKCLDGSQKSSRMTNRSDDDCWRCPVCAYLIDKPGRIGRHRVESEWDPYRH